MDHSKESGDKYHVHSRQTNTDLTLPPHRFDPSNIANSPSTKDLSFSIKNINKDVILSLIRQAIKDVWGPFILSQHLSLNQLNLAGNYVGYGVKSMT